MPIDPTAVGSVGKSVRRSWKSKDALLYALGVGAGVDELAFTTETTKDTPQRVLPTMAVVLGGGGVPFDKLGSFNAALMLHGAQAIELFGEIPADGEIESTGGYLERRAAAVIVERSTLPRRATQSRASVDSRRFRGPDPHVRSSERTHG